MNQPNVWHFGATFALGFVMAHVNEGHWALAAWDAIPVMVFLAIAQWRSARS